MMQEHFLTVHRQETPPDVDLREAHRRLFPRCPLEAAEAFCAQHPDHDLKAIVKRSLKLQAGYDPQDRLEVQLSRHLEACGLLQDNSAGPVN